jgi:RNA polymerase sigma-70 factor (ECF subfamily)
MTEAEAIARLKRGDIGGLDELVNLYYVQAVRTAYLVLQDRTMAEDIAQAAFLRVYERIGQFDANRSFAPWFLRGVVNDSLMLGRKQERTVSLEGTSSYLEDLLPSLDPSPEDLLLAAETNQAIWGVLDRLSVAHRAVIVKRYFLGLSEAEIASQLDCPPGTVKSRLYNAKQRIKQMLPAWLIPPVCKDQ